MYSRRDMLKTAALGGMLGAGATLPLVGDAQAAARKHPVRPKQKLTADVVIVGGGMAGVCAAIASARNGAETILVQDRPVLGGNASSEVRMNISGASVKHPNAREGGVLEELQLECGARNPQNTHFMLDLVLWEKCHFQPRLTLMLNTVMTDCRVDDYKIRSISCYGMRTETWYTIEGHVFMDVTGDGTLGVRAGNPYMQGQESKSEFGETLAPDEATDYTLGSSLLFQARAFDRPMPFIKPTWAHSYPADSDILRGHEELNYGWWWLEWGGTLDTIQDDDRIREELLKILYGVWDHVKNQGDHGAENHALEWVGCLPGRRESRRLKGAYILREQDVMSGRIFDDEVAYGGWAIDHHYPHGFHHRDGKFWHPTRLDQPYSVPLRSLYSGTIHNLFLGGRSLSASHLAFCTTRVMATCAVMGQGAGTAAAHCATNNILPREISSSDIADIKQTLLHDDAYLLGTCNEDSKDLARKASFTAGSVGRGTAPEKVVDGVARQVGLDKHQWRSLSLRPQDAWLAMDFGSNINCRELHLKFDTNYDRRMRLTHKANSLAAQVNGPQPETVKDYRIEAYIDGAWKQVKEVTGNFQRMNVHQFTGLRCDKIRVHVSATHGVTDARIFEVRCYS